MNNCFMHSLILNTAGYASASMNLLLSDRRCPAPYYWDNSANTDEDASSEHCLKHREALLPCSPQ